jgi:FkbM family methyltransferase
MNLAVWAMASVVKALLPRRARSALYWLWLEKSRRGRPFPFVVREPQSDRSLNCCIGYNRYGAYCVPVSGLRRPAALCVLAGKVWEAPTIDLMVSLCEGGDIVHAGTFFGDFLPALAAACAAAGHRVWAFEPNPESYRCAAVTLELNEISNVALINAGLGERSDNRHLVTAEKGISLGGASHIASGALGGPEARGISITPIRIVTVDDTVPQDRPVSVIQLDVEGYEEQALIGAMRTIRRYRPLLILETVPGDAWLAKNLAPFGYCIAESFLENTVLRPNPTT